MNKTLLAIIIFIIIILGYAIEDAVSDVTSSNATSNQTNVSGGNTSIQGYEATTNNTYQGQVTNSTTNSTSNSSNQETDVNSANSPSMSSYGQDSCVVPLAGAVSVMSISASAGSYIVDENCERRKTSKLLKSLGMSVASIALMCQDENVWLAMAASSTFCPIDGLIGDAAKKRWEEVGGFHKPYEKKWNMRPIPSGAIKHKR